MLQISNLKDPWPKIYYMCSGCVFEAEKNTLRKNSKQHNKG